MTAADWWIVLLLPPAVFGIMIAVDQHRTRARQRRWDQHTHQALRQAKDRHPSTSRYDQDCGRPDCGVCNLYRNRWNG